MSRREDFSQIPRAVADLLEESAKGLPSPLRSARLGEGPVIVLSGVEHLPVAWTALYAFESLLGRPAMVRTPAVFEHYSVQAVVPRSALFVLRGAARSDETLRALKKARDGGAIVWAFANPEDEALVKLAHGVLPWLPAAADGGILPAVLEHVAAVSFVVHAARLLRPPSGHLQECEQDLARLPGEIDRLFSTLQDAARGFVKEVQERRRILVSGGGSYHAAALEAAHSFERGFGIDCQASEASEMTSGAVSFEPGNCTVLFLSGSRCRIKKQIQEAASKAQIGGADVFSITDRDDRELAARSEQAVLLPPQTELTGALLAMTFAMWMSALPERKSGTRK